MALTGPLKLTPNHRTSAPVRVSLASSKQPSANTKLVALPANFLKGVAISVWQNAPCQASQWSRFSKRLSLETAKHRLLHDWSRPHPEHDLDLTPDFWNRYMDDIEAAKQLGCTSMRVSLEWSRIQPYSARHVDEDAVTRYKAMFDAMHAAGIEPMVTLHHFTHPQWFQEAGAFENDDCTSTFADWAALAYRHFGSRVHLWGTFNEPTCAAFMGYIAGAHAPGKLGRMQQAGEVLLNMLRCHTCAYHAIKAADTQGTACVGLVHNHMQFMPKSDGPQHTYANYMSKKLLHWFGWHVVHDYMKQGVFRWEHLPGGEVWEANGPPPLDWMGVNYYTRVVLDWRAAFTIKEGQIATDFGYPLDAEGLRVALHHAADLGVPIYITETGVADRRDDRRAHCIRTYWEAMTQAVQEGVDVRGFYLWTLVDNYEWDKGYTLKFGLYAWDPRAAQMDALEAAMKDVSTTPCHAHAALPTAASSVELKQAGGSNAADVCAGAHGPALAQMPPAAMAAMAAKAAVVANVAAAASSATALVAAPAAAVSDALGIVRGALTSALGTAKQAITDGISRSPRGSCSGHTPLATGVNAKGNSVTDSSDSSGQQPSQSDTNCSTVSALMSSSPNGSDPAGDEAITEEGDRKSGFAGLFGSTRISARITIQASMASAGSLDVLLPAAESPEVCHTNFEEFATLPTDSDASSAVAIVLRTFKGRTLRRGALALLGLYSTTPDSLAAAHAHMLQELGTGFPAARAAESAACDYYDSTGLAHAACEHAAMCERMRLNGAKVCESGQSRGSRSGSSDGVQTREERESARLAEWRKEQAREHVQEGILMAVVAGVMVMLVAVWRWVERMRGVASAQPYVGCPPADE